MKKEFGLLSLLLACIASPVAQASILEYRFEQTFSGQSPAGAAPWVIARFDDHDTTGNVRLTISTAGLSGYENISAIYFNLDPALDSASLSFAYVSGVYATGVDRRRDGFRADGDGRYDLRINYPTGGGFDAGETSAYDIGGLSTLTAQSFFHLSTPAGGHGPFYAAAHVQNGVGGGGGWIAPTAGITVVPLPGAAGLFLAGLFSFWSFARGRKFLPQFPSV